VVQADPVVEAAPTSMGQATVGSPTSSGDEDHAHVPKDERSEGGEPSRADADDCPRDILFGGDDMFIAERVSRRARLPASLRRGRHRSTADR